MQRKAAYVRGLDLLVKSNKSYKQAKEVWSICNYHHVTDYTTGWKNHILIFTIKLGDNSSPAQFFIEDLESRTEMMLMKAVADTVLVGAGVANTLKDKVSIQNDFDKLDEWDKNNLSF